MAKIKTSDTLSLDKSKQKKVVRQTKILKKKIQDGKISLKKHSSSRASAEESRGLIYIGHIPHGFYEHEMKNYFKQFGGVTNVKVCRSNKSGNSKGYGYVEFSHPEVAKIAAETMNNYLMFKKRVVAEYVLPEKRPRGLFSGRRNTVENNKSKVRREKQKVANSKVDKDTHLKRSKARLSKLNKKLNILKTAGIDYDFKAVNLPKGIKEKQEVIEEEVSYIYQQDPDDSDIEVKVPIKTKTITSKRISRKVGVSEAESIKSDEMKVPVTPRRQIPRTPKKQTVDSSNSPVRSASSIKNKLEFSHKTPKETVTKDALKRTPRRTPFQVADSSRSNEVKVTPVTPRKKTARTPKKQTPHSSILSIKIKSGTSQKTPKEMVTKEPLKRSPRQTSKETPKQSAKNSPKQTPKKSPKKIPKKSPKQIPKKSPKPVIKRTPKQK